MVAGRRELRARDQKKAMVSSVIQGLSGRYQMAHGKRLRRQRSQSRQNHLIESTPFFGIDDAVDDEHHIASQSSGVHWRSSR